MIGTSKRVVEAGSSLYANCISIPNIRSQFQMNMTDVRTAKHQNLQVRIKKFTFAFKNSVIARMSSDLCSENNGRGGRINVSQRHQI